MGSGSAEGSVTGVAFTTTSASTPPASSHRTAANRAGVAPTASRAAFARAASRAATVRAPTPIASPRLSSIEAALDPAHVSYLYYVLCPKDGPGKHRFSTSYTDFINNKNECLG